MSEEKGEQYFMLSTYWHLSGRDPLLSVYSKMEIAKRKDILERDWPHAVRHVLP